MATGSLTAAARGAMVTDMCPAKVTRWLVPGTMNGPPAEMPMSIWLNVTGRVPN